MSSKVTLEVHVWRLKEKNWIFFAKVLTFLKTYVKYVFSDAGVAQLVERNLAKVEVASSRLVSRSRI